MDNGTWSQGNQRGLGSNVGKVGGENADCGQHAAGNVAGGYRVGSVDPNGGVDQVPDMRTPMGFNPAHGLIAANFRIAPVPANAQGVAYLDTANGSFHYARITGQGLTQTDANRAGDPGMGGTFARFLPGPDGRPSLDNLGAQRGVQPVRNLQDVNEFVNYCGQHYNLDTGFFYFCKFA